MWSSTKIRIDIGFGFSICFPTTKKLEKLISNLFDLKLQKWLKDGNLENEENKISNNS